MPYNDQVKATAAAVASSGAKPPFAASIDEVRANAAAFNLPCWVDTSAWPGVADHTVTSRDGSPVPVRVYTPDAAVHGPGPYPVHINYHGGGFVLGDLGAEASLCAKLSAGAGVVVVDVNYRHCPEADQGASFEDAWAALQWVRASADLLRATASSLSVGGISAGGNISFVVQLLARDAGVPLRLCLVTAPLTSAALTYAAPTDSPFASFRDFADDVFLGWKHMAWFGQHARRDPDPARRPGQPDYFFHLLAAPDDRLRGLCPTFVRTAEVDPLRDEGEAYGQRLVAAGNDVRFRRYLGVPHLFAYFEHLDAFAEYVAESVEALKAAHRGGSA